MDLTDPQGLHRRALALEHQANATKNPDKRKQLRGQAFDLMVQHHRLMRPN